MCGQGRVFKPGVWSNVCSTAQHLATLDEVVQSWNKEDPPAAVSPDLNPVWMLRSDLMRAANNMNQSWRSSEGRTVPNSLCRSDQQHQFSWVWIHLRFQHHCKCSKCLNKSKSIQLFMCYHLEVSVRHGCCWTLCVGEWHWGACLRAGIAMVISYCWELFLIPSVLADSHHLSSSGSWQQHLADCTGVDRCGGWLTNDAAVLSLFDHYSRVLLWQRYENKQWDSMTGAAINECFHYWLSH